MSPAAEHTPDRNSHELSSTPLTESFTQDLSPRELKSRERYLEIIKNGEAPHIVIISGLPGAGKTTLYNFLKSDKDYEYIPAIRFMPRGNRPSDTAGDLPWPLAESFSGSREEKISATSHPEYGPESVVFANHKYTGYYGFSGKDLLEQLQQKKTPVMFVTSYSEMTPLLEGLNSVLPLLPVVSLRMEVPHEILPGRLHQRAEAHPGEVQERVRKLDQLAREDLLQTPKLVNVYGTRVLWNVTPAEIQTYGYFPQQIQAVSEDGLKAMVAEARDTVVERSKRQAADILRVRELNYGSELIPDSLLEVMDRVLLPTAQRLGTAGEGTLADCSIIVKAGLAAAIYLEDDARVVSPDIDFTLPISERSHMQMEVLMEALGGGVLPDWDDGWNKAVYHCRGLKGSARSSDGTEVELDALLLTRVQPFENGFVFDFKHDEHDLFFRRTVRTPAGNTFPIVPPEQLAIEKLVAGRGPEINKFDLYDAAGVLSKYDLNPNLIRKLVEQQRFDLELDAAAAEAIEADDFLISVSLLEELGLQNTWTKEAALRLGELLEDDKHTLPSEKRVLTLTALKQFAFVDAVLRSLDKIEREMHTALYNRNGREVTLAEQFDAAAIQQGVSKLRSQMLLHVEYYVGAGDVYVNRHIEDSKRQQAFFSGLDAQRERLQYFRNTDRNPTSQSGN